MTIAAQPARVINRLIIHHSATPNGRETHPAIINDWHRARGWRRTDPAAKWWRPELNAIGYHHVIGIAGMIWPGRHPDERGAHALHANSDSIGICLVGMDAYTREQWAALRLLIAAYRADHPAIQIIGHRDVPGAATECPGFDVAAWLRGRETLSMIYPR